MANGFSFCFAVSNISSGHRSSTVVNDQEKKFRLLVDSEFAVIDKGEFTERFASHT